ncbi:MAG: hypothetical protein PW734_12755 [Verrucomicrobium sp.]|nr:hypothetical protein [Verrucomicrobium sp.]
MKRLFCLAVLGLLGISAALAQTANNHGTTQFTSPNNLDSQMTKQIPGGKGPIAPDGRFAPRPSGVLYELSQKGPILISPLAPPQYGIGQRFLTPNPTKPELIPTEVPQGQDRDFGGIKLFGWDF